MGRQRLAECLAQATSKRIDDADPIALQGGQGGKCPNLPQAPVGTCREVKPRRIRTIDDIYVVVAGQHQRQRGQFGIGAESVLEFCPFGGPTRVGHITGDQDCRQRLARMYVGEPGENLLPALVALGPRCAALDPETISFAHHVDVGQVRHAPCAALMRARLRVPP